MTTFEKHLNQVRANLERLETLFTKHPELFDTGHGIWLDENHVSVCLHASHYPERDWRAFAAKYPAGWKRARGVRDDADDWSGTLNGVSIKIIGCEPRQLTTLVFCPALGRF